MQLHHWWWIMTLVLGVAELLSGTFYLLVLAIGSAAAGLSAWLGGSLTVQVFVAAGLAVAGWAWLFHRDRRPGGRPASDSDPDILLDVGTRLRIDDWIASRHTRAQYRGAGWAVELDEAEPDEAGRPGLFVIARVVGSQLIVRRAD